MYIYIYVYVYIDMCIIYIYIYIHDLGQGPAQGAVGPREVHAVVQLVDLRVRVATFKSTIYMSGKEQQHKNKKIRQINNVLPKNTNTKNKELTMGHKQLVVFQVKL